MEFSGVTSPKLLDAKGVCDVIVTTLYISVCVRVVLYTQIQTVNYQEVL
jgi:hypothetical protein